MARAKRTTCISFRCPNALYTDLAAMASACEWAVNTELVAAAQFWARQEPAVRAEQRGRTKAAGETEAGRGYQRQSGEFAKAVR